MNQAKDARANGQQVLVVRMNKNKKFQKEQLMKEGYEEFVEFFNRQESGKQKISCVAAVPNSYQNKYIVEI